MKTPYLSTQYFTTSYGELILGSFKGRLCLCDWHDRKGRSTVDSRIDKGLAEQGTKTEPAEHSNDETLEQARQQLHEYFNGDRRSFDVLLLTVGTAFQKSVWNRLLAIPYGETLSYRQLAEALGNPKAVRAVASANGANALSIFVPCHRVIGSNGKLVGYAGGLQAKAGLLSLEADPSNTSCDS